MTAPASSAPPTAATSAPGWRLPLLPFTDRNFRLFWVGMFFSSGGVWAQRIAQDWLVLELTNSPTWLGFVTMTQYLPTLLFGLFAGVTADRYSKRRIQICTQLSMIVLSSLLATLCLTGVVEPWQVVTIAFCVGTVFAFDLPTRQSFLNELVPEAQLRNAIGLTASAFQIGALVGPAASGAVIAAVGPGYSFLGAAAIYAVPMVALLRIDSSKLDVVAHQTTAGRTLVDLRDGLRYVARRPEILWITVLVGIFGTFISSLPVSNAAFARLVFDIGPDGYGLLSAVVAVGALVGAVIAATRRRRPRLRTNLTIGATLATLYMLAAIVPGLAGYTVVLAAIGAATMAFVTTCNSTVQIAVDGPFRGRVMGLYNLVFIGGGAVGGLFIGVVDAQWGPRQGMFLSGAIPAVVLLFISVQLARSLHLRVRIRPSSDVRRLISVTSTAVSGDVPGGPTPNRPAVAAGPD